MKQGQETNQIWTHEVGTHDTHDRGLTVTLIFDLNSISKTHKNVRIE